MLTQQQIIALAVEAGIVSVHAESGNAWQDGYAALERFAALVAKQERNACLAEIETGIWMDKTTEEVLAEIAEAIRARCTETKEQ